MVGFAALVLWGTWRSDKTPDGTKPEKIVVRQAARFEAARDPTPAPAPSPSALMQPMAMPAAQAVVPAAQPVQRTADDQLLDSARRAPVLIYNRPSRPAPPGPEAELNAYADDPLPYGLGLGQPGPRNELADKLKATPIEGVRAARLPNRHLLVTQGTSIPCVLETAMSSDVPGFVSCLVQRDVMSDSGRVVLMEKGTQVAGEYRGNVRRGSRRMFVLWTRAKTPKGVIVALASPATDALGRSGFDGDIDTQFFERFGAALLLSIVNDAGTYANRQLSEADIDIRNTTNAGNSAAAIAVERSIDIPPTLNKNQGELVNIFVARDLDFRSVYDLHVVGTRTEIFDRTVTGVYKR